MNNKPEESPTTLLKDYRACSLEEDYDTKYVQSLLDKGADPNVVNREGKTPLMKAVEYPSIEGVKILLKYGADPNTQTDEFTPLMKAIDFIPKLEIIKVLLQHGADPNQTACDHTALTLAAFQHSSAPLQLILENGGDPNLHDTGGITPLMAAAHRGKVENMQILLEWGADVHMKIEGTTALHFAVVLYESESRVDCIRLLLENNADPNIKDKRGHTPLVKACWYSQLASAKCLLEYYEPDVTIHDSQLNYAFLATFRTRELNILYLLAPYLLKQPPDALEDLRNVFRSITEETMKNGSKPDETKQYTAYLFHYISSGYDPDFVNFIYNYEILRQDVMSGCQGFTNDHIRQLIKNEKEQVSGLL